MFAHVATKVEIRNWTHQNGNRFVEGIGIDELNNVWMGELLHDFDFCQK